MPEEIYRVVQFSSAGAVLCLAIVLLSITAGPMASRPLVERQTMWTFFVAAVGGWLLRMTWILKEPMGGVDVAREVALVAHGIILVGGIMTIIFGCRWIYLWRNRKESNASI